MLAITTHHNADFDALASMVAVNKLYHEAQAVYPANLSPNVAEFVSLYKDKLPVKTHKEFDLSLVTALVVTDTRQRRRLQLFQPYWDNIREVHIIDHHPETEDDIPAKLLTAEQVGATTTIIVEKLLAEKIEITPFEATLFILGIFEDTGSLTFESTTVRDVEAVCRLWQIGVNLRIVNAFLHQPLNAGQRDLLDELLSATEYYEIRGLRIGVACTRCDEYVAGLAMLTQKLLELEDVDVMFCVVSMESKVHIVGRSRMQQVDLTSILEEFNGKGHSQAASALVPGETHKETGEKLVLSLYRKIPAAKTVREIMSSPVRSVTPETTVEQAHELMLRYGHSGFPVMSDEQLVGIISRRDLDKATHHGLGHAPVKGYMSKKPLTVELDASVREVQQLMVAKDIGRLPVMDGTSVAGLVTRTDILRTLERDEIKEAMFAHSMPASGDDLLPLMKERLSQKMQGKLVLIGQKADRENVKAYVVGGFVRDLLLGRPNQDLDLVVEPLAIPFAKKLHEYLGGRIVTHEQFGTATLTLTNGDQIDLVTARQEFYARPAAMPEVELGSLKNDLYRRDFTINTLAFCLNSPYFGRLTDFFGGINDLSEGIIRVLYNLSFVEDPLRVLRAVRFEQRFAFRFDETTMSLLENAVHTRVLEKVSKERLYDEFALIFKEEKTARILIRLFELHISTAIFPGVKGGEPLYKRIYAVQDILAWAKRTWPDARPQPEVIYLAAIMQDLPFGEARHLCRRLRLPKEIKKPVLTLLEALPKIKKETAAAHSPSPSLLDEWFGAQPVETLLLLQSQSLNSQVWQNITDYWEKVRFAKPAINGRDLEALGFRPGPGFQTALKAVRKAQLDGQVHTKEEELDLARKILANAAYGEENSVASDRNN